MLYQYYEPIIKGVRLIVFRNSESYSVATTTSTEPTGCWTQVPQIKTWPVGFCELHCCQSTICCPQPRKTENAQVQTDPTGPDRDYRLWPAVVESYGAWQAASRDHSPLPSHLHENALKGKDCSSDCESARFKLYTKCSRLIVPYHAFSS